MPPQFLSGYKPIPCKIWHPLLPWPPTPLFEHLPWLLHYTHSSLVLKLSFHSLPGFKSFCSKSLVSVRSAPPTLFTIRTFLTQHFLSHLFCFTFCTALITRMHTHTHTHVFIQFRVDLILPEGKFHKDRDFVSFVLCCNLSPKRSARHIGCTQYYGTNGSIKQLEPPWPLHIGAVNKELYIKSS